MVFNWYPVWILTIFKIYSCGHSFTGGMLIFGGCIKGIVQPDITGVEIGLKNFVLKMFDYRTVNLKRNFTYISCEKNSFLPFKLV
jgi:hypothetical protein